MCSQKKGLRYISKRSSFSGLPEYFHICPDNFQAVVGAVFPLFSYAYDATATLANSLKLF